MKLIKFINEKIINLQKYQDDQIALYGNEWNLTSECAYINLRIALFKFQIELIKGMCKFKISNNWRIK